MPIPERWMQAGVWAWLRRVHAPASTVMAATPALVRELGERGFRNVGLWSRGVDTNLFRPQPDVDLGLPRPIFLTVGRLAPEKNLDAFLGLDLPGTKVVVGDGPAGLSLRRRYPEACFLGVRSGEALAQAYAAADVFVFPSRTDTYGLVMLEALASGVPVAAFPVSGPRDVIGDAPVGVLDPDLRAACLRALTIPRAACRSFAVDKSWSRSAELFLRHVHAPHRLLPLLRPDQVALTSDRLSGRHV
jgi:glycosyltransferase involved in cell wall biosynthesis